MCRLSKTRKNLYLLPSQNSTIKKQDQTSNSVTKETSLFEIQEVKDNVIKVSCRATMIMMIIV